jgi:peroxin-5
MSVSARYYGPSLSQDTAFQGSSFQQELRPQSSHQEPKQEDPNDAYFRRENETYSNYWQSAQISQHPQSTDSWNQLQDQWDSFEATATGIKPIVNYQFQSNNPYLFGDSSTTRLRSDGRSQAFYEVRLFILLRHRKFY